jgi:hypothetical protein
MQSARPQITFPKLAGVWFASLSVVTLAAACVWFMATVRAGSRPPLAGEWVGTCQDGRPFVRVSLRPAVGGYGGTISLGNVKVTSQPGAPVGTCRVNDPPSAEHAIRIAKASLAGEMLTFDSDHGQEYEMERTGGDTAELRFVGTNRDESWFGLRRVR